MGLFGYRKPSTMLGGVNALATPGPRTLGGAINALSGAQYAQRIPGNIDIYNRPIVRNPDGSISTVRTISFGSDDGEVLVPTVSEDGRIMSDDEAIDQYYRTGRHLGIFDTPEEATLAAEKLHQQQERYYPNPARK